MSLWSRRNRLRRVGSAPRQVFIDWLGSVAMVTDWVGPGYELHELVLGWGDVLELVDEEVPGTDLVPERPGLRVELHGPDGQGYEVVEVEHVLALFLLGVEVHQLVPVGLLRGGWVLAPPGAVEPRATGGSS